MNCYSFKKKLDLYLEGQLQKDIKASMDKHINQCVQCRKIYEEEKEIEELLSKALSFEKIDFKSSKNEIINSIDKDKYKKGYKSNVKYHFIKNKKLYVMAASFLLILIMIPFMRNYIVGLRAENQIGKSVSNDKDINNKGKGLNSIAVEDSSKINSSKDISYADNINLSIDHINDQLFSEDSRYKEVNFKILDQEAVNKLLHYGKSKEKVSPSKRYSAYIIGRGSDGRELGDGAIAINDNMNKTTKYYNTSIVDDGFTDSPKYVEWVADDILLFIVGAGYSDEIKGGNLYALNMKTGISVLVYGVNVPSEQINSVKYSNEKLELSIIHYTDYHFKSYTVSNKTLGVKIQDNKKMLDSSQKNEDSKIIRDYNSLINSEGNINKDNILSDRVKFDDLKNSKDSLVRGKTHVSFLINIEDEEYDKYLKKSGLDSVKVYGVEFESDDKNQHLYQKIILGKEKPEDHWKIYYVFTLPQGYADIKN
ncbi:DUF4652 domain-containing protein [Clostridium manihotivorum]|uniref:Zinc-finger domain-containing protein n=1 Tax=Clostridium manihotivorum TaxID=2320868 RepID=A0A3R5X015_9CLOT|nr:DUF4652 domain-containing protein [Clostridium manihotivorum]QAA30885.1 hypothetical protein C1I91_03960 [Clostridium manihotivorum]